MVTGQHRGHMIFWDEETGDWRYLDDKSLADYERPCTQCNKMPTPEGHDACLGHIPGVLNACCGHGAEPGYIQWEECSEVVTILPENLSDMLRWVRDGTGLKLHEVAEKTGLSVSFISDLENGRSNPSFDTLSKLACAYGVNISVEFGAR